MKSEMTTNGIAAIIKRAVMKECEADAVVAIEAMSRACLTVAQAVLEQAARFTERIKVDSYHCSEAMVLRAVAKQLRALAAQGPGGGEGR